MAGARRIDVHFHMIPQFYADMVYAAGSGPAIGRYPDWSPELALEIMDRFDIATALTVAGQPGVQFCKPAEAKTLARRCNDYSAELNAQAWQALRRVRHGVDVGRAPRGRGGRLLPRHAEVLRRQPVRQL